LKTCVKNIRTEENTPTGEETEEEEHEDTNDVQVNNDGPANLSEAESNVVLVKGSVVLISQDGRVSASFLFGTLAQDWQRRTMETVKTHVYVHYEFTGLVRTEKIVQEVAMRSDMWTYLDDDFHVEISDELYHHCLALVCDKGNADTEKFASVPSSKTDKGRTLRLPRRLREKNNEHF